MTPANPLSPAPGRTIVPLDRGWTAVVIRPLAGHPFAFVDLFRDGADAPELELNAGETRRFLRALRRGPARPTTTGTRPASDVRGDCEVERAPFR